MRKLSLRTSCQLALLFLLVLAGLTPGALAARELAPSSAPQAQMELDSQASNIISNAPNQIGLAGVQGVVTLDVSVPDTIRAGDPIDYTYTYVNTGSTTATGLRVEAIWTNFSVNLNGNWQFCSPSNTCDVLVGSVQGPAVTRVAPPVAGTPNVRFNIGNLAPGQQGRFTVRLGTLKTIYPRTGQQVSRPAGSGNLYINNGNTPISQDTAATLVVGPVFVLTKTATTTGKIYPTETGAFVVHVGNATGSGDSTNGELRADARPATNLVVEDTFPAGAEFVSASGNYTIDTTNPNAKTITWTIPGPLNPGNTIDLQVVFRKLDVKIDCATLNNSKLTVTSDQMPLNDTSRYTISGKGASVPVQVPMVIKSVAATPGSVVYGDSGTITIVVQNFWDHPVTGATLYYVVQSNATYTPGTASPAPTSAPDGTQPGGTIIWPLNMPAGSITSPTEATFTLDVVGGYTSTAQSGTGRAQLVAPAGVPSACIATRDGRLGLNPRLRLTKTTDADPATKLNGAYVVERGDEFNYIITVTNSGVTRATGVNIKDNLPKEIGANFRYVQGSASLQPTTVTDGPGGVIAWSDLTIEAGETLEISYRLNVDGRDFQQYCNSASGGSETFSYGPTRVCVKINPNILVTKTVNKAIANPGDTVRFTLTLMNQESVPYTVGLYDKLNSFVNARQVSGYATPTSPSQSTLSWPLVTLQPGQQVQAVIDADVPATCVTRDYVNEALFHITDGLIQPIPSVTAKVHVTCGQIQYSKNSDRGTVSLQDRIVYTLPIKNAGASTVTNVEVDDILPQGFSFVGMEGTSAILASPATQTIADGRTKLSWTIPSIAVNTTVNIRYIARSGDVVGSYENWVTVPVGGKCVTACKTDTDGTIYSVRSVTVQPLITMEPKITPTGCAQPGDQRTYQLSILNTNKHDYANTQVVLTLPLGLRYSRALSGTPEPIVAIADNGVSTVRWSGLRIPAKPDNAFASQVVLEVQLQVGQVWGNLDTVVATTSSDGLIPRKDGVSDPTVQVCPTNPAITKDVNRSVVSAESDVLYQIMLANPTNSPFSATIEDQLPNNFSFVGNVQGVASVSGNTLTWANVTVPPASNGLAGILVLKFTAHVNTAAPGASYTNTATVVSSSVPLDTAYNSVSITIASNVFLPLLQR